MIRINLLPPEIIQKRKDEQYWRWLALGAVLVFVVLAGVFLLMQIQVSVKAEEVARIRQQAAEKSAEAERFKIFQVKEADLANRQAIANVAVGGRVDWSRLYSELALILPTDIYILRVSTTEPKGGTVPAPGKVTMDGKAIDYPQDVPDLGYKSVAKLLVRIADLSQLDSVWLSSSAKQPVASETSTATPYITFNVSANILGSTATSTPGVPAPPN